MHPALACINFVSYKFTSTTPPAILTKSLPHPVPIAPTAVQQTNLYNSKGFYTAASNHIDYHSIIRVINFSHHCCQRSNTALIPIENLVSDVVRAAKKTKPAPIAVVGKGLTAKNFAMKDWLSTHPGGVKADFKEFQDPVANGSEGFRDASKKKLAAATKLAGEKLHFSR
ncbi:hypothetical protein C0992_002868 [Termitomyces sp. T32_za158]|nr:hypothetical protein C0992_002868 [Termitomyces sp. T32_za158]